MVENPNRPIGKEFGQALKEIPLNLIEISNIASLSALLTYGVTYYGQFANGEIVNLYLSSASALTYTLGRVVDAMSSIKCLESIDLADKLGIEHPVVELNPLLGEKPKVKEFLNHKVIYRDYITSAISVIIPPVGFALGM